MRWHFLTVFAAAILAGFGTAALRERYSKALIGRTSAGFLIAPLVLAIVLTELAPRWIETRPVTQPDFVTMLRRETGTFAIYDRGLRAEALLRQTGHGRPLVSGYVSRITREAAAFVQKTPVLLALRGQLRLPPDEIRRQAQKLNLRFVIVPDQQETATQMSELGLRLHWQEQGLQVWEVAP